MSEEILKALMHLFAIIARVDKDGDIGFSKNIVKAYLKQHLNQAGQTEYLELFNQYVHLHHHGTDEATKNKKRTSLNSVKVLMICQQINSNLQQSQKILVLIQLLEFIKNGLDITSNEREFVETVSDTFNIDEKEYHSIYNFIFNVSSITQNPEYLAIKQPAENEHPDPKKIYRENLDGTLHFLHIKSTNMYAFKYEGISNIFLNGTNIPNDRTLFLDKGSSIRSSKIKPIYYSDIVGVFLHSDKTSKIVLTAVDVNFHFKNTENGIRNFTFSEESGEVIGIMGGSGVGKSTLLHVLNGNLKPQTGNITINGIDIYKETEKLKGLIGFVPQDDLLIEELTVFQNIYYNARLCFANTSDESIRQTVDKLLSDLDLQDVRNLTVGNPLNKFISGGQRKRLNIALELIREPAVLFVDEPTSGLSSMDSNMVMDLLKEQALKGKLVIVNIHQPSSDIYKMLDKLLILDKGGYLVFYGNPIDAITYFKRQSNYVMAEESECAVCGHINPEQVLQIIEKKVVDEYGKLTKNRKVSPKEWNDIYVQDLQPQVLKKRNDYPLPKNNFKLPGLFQQFHFFFLRNVLSKLTNWQYMFITLLEAPILACVLGFLSKQIAGTSQNTSQYIFSLNENIPAYLFMSVVCSLFLGLTISAEEIIRDNKIIKREQFLNLSHFSYINSKVTLMFIISAIQTISFVLLGNWILEIKGMTMSSFMILFSSACFANLLGLTISSTLNSVVTIYISIPFILVPQLLLSGVIVDFDKLHKSIANDQYVSIAGDLMISRWAYEAMAVNQFKNNEYEQKFFAMEKEMSDAAFKKNFLIPELASYADFCKTMQKNDSASKEKNRKWTILKTELAHVTKKQPKSLLVRFKQQQGDTSVYKSIKHYLDSTKQYFENKYNYFYQKREDAYNQFISQYGRDSLIHLKNDYYNQSLADIVLNNNEMTKIAEKNGRLIQYMEPIFKQSNHSFGRAQFYASEKPFWGRTFDTIWFNIIIMWIGTIILYLLLLFNGVKKAAIGLGSLLFPKRIFDAL